MRYEMWEGDKGQWILYDRDRKQILLMSRDKRIIANAIAKLKAGGEWPPATKGTNNFS